MWHKYIFICCSSQEIYKSDCLHGYPLEIKPKNGMWVEAFYPSSFILLHTLDDHINKHKIYDTKANIHINELICYMYYMCIYMSYNPYNQIIHCMIKEY